MPGAQVLGVREDGEIAGGTRSSGARTARLRSSRSSSRRSAAAAAWAPPSTCAAIKAVGDVEDLWICADDERRAKQLYARLGFRPAWMAMEFLRLP